MTPSARTFLGIVTVVVALEALAVITVALLGIADVSGARIGVGLGVGTLLIAYGFGLLFATWQLRRGRRWARAPILVAQLIQLLLANDARDGAAWVTPGLAVSALVVLACLLAPPVTRALSANESV
ncbi:hypothetical protein [Aeromicrobium sp.]|uniref:hypothetical protein n=1 Tax=Aeromicrobium sp. TaxID=1871063 RepID=UPI003D6B437B